MRKTESTVDPCQSPTVKPGSGHRKRKLIEVALIDPRPLMRASFTDLLKMSSRDFSVKNFSNAQELVNQFVPSDSLPSTTLGRRRTSPGRRKTDDVSSELKLIVFSNIDVHKNLVGMMQDNVRLFQQTAPNVPLAILGNQEDKDCIIKAIRNGASGYIPTSLTPSVAIAALRLILAGGKYLPEDIIFDTLNEQLPQTEEHQSSTFDQEIFNSFNLTERQQEVLRLLRQGKSNKLIAYEIGTQGNRA